MSELLIKQQTFSRLVPSLIIHAHVLGFEVTLGDCFRDPRVHGKFGEKSSYSHRNSAHKLKLAIDLNLHKDGVYCTGTEAHRCLGAFWKERHPDNRWGGDFTKPDGNHYSHFYRGYV